MAVDLTLVIPLSGAAALGFAAFLARDVLRRPTGTPKMQEIAQAIQDGARAFLRRQYVTIALIAAIVAVVFAVALGVTQSPVLGLKTAGAFALGATLSALSGYVGMQISIRANLRSAAGSLTSFREALSAAFRGGAVSGFAIVAFSLLGVAVLYYGYAAVTPAFDPANTSPHLLTKWDACMATFSNDTATCNDRMFQDEIVLSIVGFGFGASLVALFAQLGGGIYTKAADVGADLVGKVEAGIPEDDARNPAVVADLVGDNVGDCAGRGADLFESTAAENIGAMILGVALFPFFGLNGVLFPLVARGFGILASIVGVMAVRAKEDEAPMSALNRGYAVTTGIAMVLFAVAAYLMLQPAAVTSVNPDNPLQTYTPSELTWLYFLLCGVVGMVTSFLFVWITQYYTEAKHRPVREIATASETGPATNIISGFAVGLESVALPGIVISAALLVSFYLGELSNLKVFLPIPGTTQHIALGGGLYGTAIATMGMLATAAYILAMDTFGPIVDNAAGIAEMSGQSKEVRDKMDKLDAAGNTTKALTKGYAVGSAALAAFLLFSAYLEATGLVAVDLAKPAVFVGAFLGVTLVFLFSSLAIRAVGRAAWSIIKDVRDQFKEKPGIMAGTEKPDYGRTVDLATRGALREMVAPGLLAVLSPVAVGLLLRAESLAGFLMVGTIGGVLLALVLNTGGGAWDNAKKHIEASGKKGTALHKAAVVGDTVGDPFKDTAGPSLHILVKLLSTITLVLAPLFI